MDARADDRWRGGLLAGLAVAALAAGGWWWWQSAPATGPVPAAVGSAGPTEADLDRLVLVSPEDGRVLAGPEADPDEPLVFHQEPGDPDATLISHTVWQDRSQLTPVGPTVVRQTSPSKGDRYLLVVSCTGTGKLVVSFSGSDDDGSDQPVACSGALFTVTLNSAGGPLRVRFTVTAGDVDLDARLAALF
ncbi:hypothetical protein [Micromonospora coerulea]|uniref:hypothetical protein n=1 Tax=Micromonospora coerulea TaxID=47856 RepID=UPI001905F192|nr:hypothetical protein [Micromonospora veneta]